MAVRFYRFKPRAARNGKYNATRTEIDGIKFASKKEAQYYCSLKQRKMTGGDIEMFLMQTPFVLPGNSKYFLDFMEFHRDGTIHFVEVKGMDLPMGKLKRKLTESLYPVEIEVV